MAGNHRATCSALNAASRASLSQRADVILRPDECPAAISVKALALEAATTMFEDRMRRMLAVDNRPTNEETGGGQSSDR